MKEKTYRICSHNANQSKQDQKFVHVEIIVKISEIIGQMQVNNVCPLHWVFNIRAVAYITYWITNPFETLSK